MTNKEIFKKVIDEFSKNKIICSGNKHPESVKGFLNEYLLSFKIKNDDINEIRQMIFDYYNL